LYYIILIFRGDVIGVKSLDDPNKFICKRIVAMAGDKVYNEVSNERIWVGITCDIVYNMLNSETID
jgi:hypothetical protein